MIYSGLLVAMLYEEAQENIKKKKYIYNFDKMCYDNQKHIFFSANEFFQKEHVHLPKSDIIYNSSIF